VYYTAEGYAIPGKSYDLCASSWLATLIFTDQFQTGLAKVDLSGRMKSLSSARLDSPQISRFTRRPQLAVFYRRRPSRSNRHHSHTTQIIGTVACADSGKVKMTCFIISMRLKKTCVLPVNAHRTNSPASGDNKPNHEACHQGLDTTQGEAGIWA
jgi:hypothetical protein